MVVLGIAWVPFISRISGQLYIYLQSVQGYISPPIAACFILGILWPRLNAQGAISSLLTGFVLGTVRFVLELDYPGGVGAPGAIQGLIAMNFLHYAIVMFVACCAVLIGVSMVTPAPDRKKLAGLTFATVNDKMDIMPVVGQYKPAAETAREHKLNVVFSVILVLTIVLLYIKFW
jgi:SSS family solute:Na+ symporter